jgi:hypothetical protein
MVSLASGILLNISAMTGSGGSKTTGSAVSSLARLGGAGGLCPLRFIA